METSPKNIINKITFVIEKQETPKTIDFFRLTFSGFPRKITWIPQKRGGHLIIKFYKILPLVGLAAALMGLSWYLGTCITPQQLQSLLSDLGPWAAGVYIGLFTLLSAFFFPVAGLALAGGLAFSLSWGSIYTVAGAMLNCTLMFFLARNLRRTPVEAPVRKHLSHKWQQRLVGAGESRGFWLLVILRLIPCALQSDQLRLWSVRHAVFYLFG